MSAQPPNASMDTNHPFSPVSPESNIQASPSTEKEVARLSGPPEKEVARLSGPPERWLSEKEFVSPATPVTDYSKRPYEAPQAMSVDPKFLVLHERDQAGEAPEVVDPTPPYLPKKLAAETDGFFGGPGSADEATIVGAGSVRRNSLEALTKDDDSKWRKHKVCGLSPTAFWIILLLVILVIVAIAVGGGVGGSMASKNKSLQAAAASSAAAASISALLASASNAASHPSTTSTSSASATAKPTKAKASATSAAAGAEPTGWYFSVWSHKNFTGAEKTISTVGLFNLSFPPSNPEMLPNPWGDPNNASTATYNSSLANSYVWVPLDTGCCVRFCKDGQSTGFRCISETHQPDCDLDKVVLACGATPDEGECLGDGIPNRRKRQVEEEEGGRLWAIDFR